MLSSILNLVPRKEVLSYYSTPIDRNIHTSIQKYEKVYMGHMLTVEWKNIPLKDKMCHFAEQISHKYCNFSVGRGLVFFILLRWKFLGNAFFRNEYMQGGTKRCSELYTRDIKRHVTDRCKQAKVECIGKNALEVLRN